MERSSLNYIMLFLLAFIWGSSFILMKRGLECFSFIELATLRISIAFISLTPFLAKAFNLINKKYYVPIIIMALFGNAIPAFLFAKAQLHINSSLVGILNSLVPFFTLIFGIYFFKEKPSRINIVGIVIGFFGVLFLSSIQLGESVMLNGFFLLIILATMFYAISINVIKKYLFSLDAVLLTSMAFFMIGPASLIYLFKTDFFHNFNFQKETLQALGFITILSVVGTSVAVVIFNKLISNTTSIFAASVTYLIPIVAIFWGFIDGEEILKNHIIGTLIILSGVYLVNKKNKNF